MSANNDKPKTSQAQDHERPTVPSAIGVDLHPTPDSFDSRTDRRTFLTLMGASVGLAGVGLSGCIRKPIEKIVPYARRPEDTVPGNPLQYATAAWIGGSVLGLLVESQEGRPTKIEGNPRHPVANPLGKANVGRTDAWTQASILDLYDPDRSRTPRHKGKKADWKRAWTFLQTHFTALKANQGAGLAVLMEATPSPTLAREITALRKALPRMKVYVDDPAWPANRNAGLALVGLEPAQPTYRLDKAKVLVAVDADPFGLEGDSVRNAQQFSAARFQEPGGDRRQSWMNRLYAVEPHYTTTGQMADNRLRASGRLCGGFLVALAAQLQLDGVDLGLPGLTIDHVGQWANAMAKETGRKNDTFQTWARELSRELRFNREKAALFVGARQPDWAHALGQVINQALQNIGAKRPIRLGTESRPLGDGTLEDLVPALKARQVKTLLMLGTNPVYTAAVDQQVGPLIGQVPHSIHLSTHVDETSRAATWHLPRTHFLEAWGDLQACDGTTSIQQPLIAPLHGAVSELTLLARLLGKPGTDFDSVRRYWTTRTNPVGFDPRWQKWLHDGVTDFHEAPRRIPPMTLDKLQVVLKTLEPPAPPKGLELAFTLDPSVYDGRYANNGWLQELPDTVSKLTWDNAAWIDVRTAKRHNVKNGDVIRLSLENRSLEIAAWVVPGVAERTVVLPLGYGRTSGGRVAKRGRGFATHKLRTGRGYHYADGARLTLTGRTYPLATTQKHGSMREPFTHKYRPVVREHTLTEYRSDGFPRVWKKYNLIPDYKNRSLWKEPNERGGHQWGMVIDLNRCLGCNTCTVACQSENVIPIVGKDEILNGRELHWIRVDRYFTTAGKGDPVKDPDAGVVVQPLPCQQCETAPCENVCPVGATLHSPEGLNDMAYNRCIGTRYCANNCPFKVRRFNFHNYTQAMDKLMPLLKMQRNPDVSVRFRGVMEKCTYCVQRIQAARIAAKTDPKKNGVIAEGDVVPACEQACPAGAIAFGNLNDPKSRASRWRKSSRNYGLLSDLNLHPRTTYLAKLRNPNPKLA